MKRKRFTKSDRRWCYTLLTLINNAAKRNRSTPGTRCPKFGKSEDYNVGCAAGESPQLINLFLNSQNAENFRTLLGNAKELNSFKSRRKSAANPDRKRVSFAENTKGSGDTNTKKHSDSHYTYSNHFKKKKTDVISNIYEKQYMKKNLNSNFEKSFGSLSEHPSMQGLISRLNKLKQNLPKTDINEDQGSIKTDDNNLMKSSGPNGSRKKIRIRYELNKNSVRKIPFGFLTEIKDVVPGGVDEIIDRHTRGKVSSSETVHSDELEVISNSSTTCFMQSIETVDQVRDTIPEAETETNDSGTALQKSDNIQVKNISAVNIKIIKNYRDISSPMGEIYKRVSLALQDINRPLFQSGQINERRDELNTNDSFEDLQKMVQGNRRIITADVNGKLTKILKKDYIIERMKLPETNKTNRNISKHHGPNKKRIVDKLMKNKLIKVDKVANVTKAKKRERTEEKIRMQHGGCECYLKSMFKDREPYLNSLEQFPKICCHT